MEHHSHDADARTDRNIALTGLGVALVWLAIVTFVSYKWALA